MHVPKEGSSHNLGNTDLQMEETLLGVYDADGKQGVLHSCYLSKKVVEENPGGDVLISISFSQNILWLWGGRPWFKWSFKVGKISIIL